MNSVSSQRFWSILKEKLHTDLECQILYQLIWFYKSPRREVLFFVTCLYVCSLSRLQLLS